MYYELTQIMRQKDEKEFIQVLYNIPPETLNAANIERPSVWIKGKTTPEYSVINI